LSSVPGLRIQVRNPAPVNPGGDFVLYWMIATRRTTWNFSLDEALGWAQTLRKPLVILEALRCGYRWASDRLHRFILDGMADNAKRLKDPGVLYYPYVEPTPNAGKGLVVALANYSCLVITDTFPEFFLPRMVEAAARKIPVRLIQVDSNGLMPLRAAEETFSTAHSFRRFLQKNLNPHLSEFPKADPFAGVSLPPLRALPAEVEKRWPRASSRELAGGPALLKAIPVDHSVGIVKTRGGATAAQAVWKEFLKERISGYLESRNQPERDGTSGLSPYLHFGHISVHQIFQDLMEQEGWTVQRLPSKATGSRGWWGMSDSAEAFLDQLITWRELGYNLCSNRQDYDQYESLPNWALRTLSDHAKDRRTYLYTQGQLETGATHDPLWNAAQMQLVREGRLHNYLRMLWGKKILEWSPTPEEALRVMIELNNKYALDGRDPNSYSGIFWVLGRYDRPWGPERPVFGKIRYMSSENTARKVQVKQYLKEYAP
jgi:deoxyribodipyrimidine photo-lyase